MTTVDESVAKYAEVGSWGKVAREVAEYDATHHDEPASPDVYAMGILAYCITGSVSGARFLFRRLPLELKANEAVAAAARVTRALWEHDAVAAQRELAKHTWEEHFLHVKKTLQEILQQRTMAILAAAYAEISTRRVCDSLGAEKAEAIALAEKAGMSYDADADVLRASADAQHAAATAAAHDEPNSHGVAAIRSVTETALLLEQDEQALEVELSKAVLQSRLASNLSPIEMVSVILKTLDWVNCRTGTTQESQSPPQN